MTMPGWYPDPHDPVWLRYFDGQQWTNDRQPAVQGPPAEQPAAEPRQDADLTMPRPASGAGSAPVPPSYPPAQQPTAYLPGGEPYAPPGQWAPQPAQQPAEPPAQWPQQPTTQPTQWLQQPAEWNAQPDRWTAPPAAEWTPPPGGQWAPTPPRRRRRLPLVLVLSVVLVAGLLTGGWFLLRKDKAPDFTFNGKAVNQPDVTLSQAEKALDVIVAQRHGAKSPDTRCYFGLAANPPKGAKKTDVDTAARCGPVLFIDGDAHRTYLSFPLTSTPSTHGSVSLAAAAAPISQDPSTVPADVSLRRPDDAKPPATGGLKVPEPPPATKNTLVAAFLTGQGVPAAPHDALMASLRGGIKLTKLGIVKRYGSGDNARTAPSGQRLVAFTYTSVPGQIGSVSPTHSQIGISLNGGGSRRLPSPGTGQVIVAAIPVHGRADVVLFVDNIRQTISLPEGKPGPSNLAVLRRSRIDAPLSVNKPMTIRFTQAGGSANLSGRVTATHALIGYWTDDGRHHASKGSKALLWMDFRFRIPNETSQTGVDAPLLTIKPAGGTAIRAKDLDPSDKVFAVFEVPATFTRGTVTIRGTEPGATAITVVTPIQFTVSMPK